MLTKSLEDKQDGLSMYGAGYYDPYLKLFYDVKDVDGELCYSRCYVPGVGKLCDPLHKVVAKKKILRLRVDTPNGIHGEYLNVSHDISDFFNPGDLLDFFNPDEPEQSRDLETITRFLRNVVNKVPNEYTLVVHDACDEFVNYMNEFTWQLYGIGKILPSIPAVKEKTAEWIDLANRIKHFTLIAPQNTLGVLYDVDENAISSKFKALPLVGSTMVISRGVSKMPGLVGSHRTIQIKK